MGGRTCGAAEQTADRCRVVPDGLRRRMPRAALGEPAQQRHHGVQHVAGVLSLWLGRVALARRLAALLRCERGCRAGRGQRRQQQPAASRGRRERAQQCGHAPASRARARVRQWALRMRLLVHSAGSNSCFMWPNQSSRVAMQRAVAAGVPSRCAAPPCMQILLKQRCSHATTLAFLLCRAGQMRTTCARQPWWMLAPPRPPAAPGARAAPRRVAAPPRRPARAAPGPSVQRPDPG